MKVLTVNFTTCAVKSCKTSSSSFPLHFKDAELELQEQEFQPEFIRNMLPRIDWAALQMTANEVGIFFSSSCMHGMLYMANGHCQLGFPNIAESKPQGEQLDDQMLRDLHRLLLETNVTEGKLVCGNCAHEYMIKDGIPNFLLPSHLGKSSCAVLSGEWFGLGADFYCSLM